MSTLQFFGVPAGSGNRSNMLMPSVKNRFRVIATNFGIPSGSIALTQQVMSVGRPNVSFTEQAVHSYNSISYFAGKAEWQDISLKVRDDATKSMSALVGAQLQKQMNFFDQTVPLAASNYKFQLLIQALDGGNDNVLEEWVLEGCFVKTFNYAENEYSSSDAMTIDMTIRMDNCTQSNGLMPLVPSLLSGVFLG